MWQPAPECMSITRNVPETGAQYVKAWHDIDCDCEPLLGGQEENCYVRKWVKRGFLRWAMQRAKKSLKVQQLTVGEYTECSPDKHKMLAPLMTDTSKTAAQNSKRLVREALKVLKYNDDADLVSMHSCLYGDIDCQTVLRSKPHD